MRKSRLSPRPNCHEHEPLAMTTQAFPFFRFRGTPREIGEQYGRAAREPIRRAASGAIERRVARGDLTAEQARRLSDAFAAQYRRYAPHLLEEIDGVARGAGITFDEALFCRTQWEMNPSTLGEGCTSFAASGRHTASGKLLCGQNKDVSPSKVEEVVILALHPNGRPSTLNYAYWGMCEGPGFNRHGFARFENSLFLGKKGGPTVPLHLLKRLFTESSCIEECVEWVRRVKADGLLGFTGSASFAEKSGRLASIEMFPGDFRVHEEPDGLLVHANDPLHPDLKPIDRSLTHAEWSDSRARTARAAAILRAPGAPRDVALAKRLLSDHEGHPGSICRHHEKSATVASLIAEPEDGLLHVSRGPPCENPYVTYRLDEPP